MTPGTISPLRTMREIGADRRRHDDGDRRAYAKLHVHVLGHTEYTEHVIEHRHDHSAATDAEQPGQQTCNQAAYHNGDGKPEKFVDPDTEQHVDSSLRHAGATARPKPDG